jgi:hypothetical protein
LESTGLLDGPFGVPPLRERETSSVVWFRPAAVTSCLERAVADVPIASALEQASSAIAAVAARRRTGGWDWRSIRMTTPVRRTWFLRD